VVDVSPLSSRALPNGTLEFTRHLAAGRELFGTVAAQETVARFNPECTDVTIACRKMTARTWETHVARERPMADDLEPDEARALRAEIPPNLDNVRTVLISPIQPGNIGSSARALKGMGLRDLWLVNAPPHWQESSEARKFAMNSRDVLFAARETDSLEVALQDAHLIVGTTHRRRVRRIAQPVAAREAAAEIARVSQAHKVVIVFGTEDKGISNEDLARCDIVASVPMATKNPSLNLSQAVQIFAYEVYTASLGDVAPVTLDLADRRHTRATIERVETLLRLTNFKPMNGRWEVIATALERFFGRAVLEKRDLDVLMKVCHDVEGYIRRNIPGASGADAQDED
jgi:TrmH family RNA methyltransferase